MAAGRPGLEAGVMDQPPVLIATGHAIGLCVWAQGAEKPQFPLQNRVRPGETMLRQTRRQQARLRGTPVVQLLAHAVFQAALPQATGLGARIAKSVAHGRRRKIQQSRADGGRAKHATGGGVVKVPVMRRPHRAAQANHDVKALDQCIEHLRPRGTAGLGHGQSRRHQHRPRVNDGGAIKIVHLQHISQRPIHQSGIAFGQTRASKGGAGPWGQGAGKTPHGQPGFGARTGTGASHPVEHMQGGAFAFGAAHRPGHPAHPIGGAGRRCAHVGSLRTGVCANTDAVCSPKPGKRVSIWAGSWRNLMGLPMCNCPWASCSSISRAWS